MSFKAVFSINTEFKASFGLQEELKPRFSSFIEVPVVDYYDGEYSITPTAEAQTIPIVGKTARQNITIEPIPQNYGLITWNGSSLTVS